MNTKDMSKIWAAIEIVQISQSLEFRLRAVITVSTGSGLDKYLQKTKKKLIINFLSSLLKMSVIAVVNAIYSIISKAIFVLHKLWLGVMDNLIQ